MQGAALIRFSLLSFLSGFELINDASSLIPLDVDPAELRCCLMERDAIT
jgi:hypothetical protein